MDHSLHSGHQTQLGFTLTGPGSDVPSEPVLLFGKDLSGDRVIFFQMKAQFHNFRVQNVMVFDMEMEEVDEAHQRLQTGPQVESKLQASSLC